MFKGKVTVEYKKGILDPQAQAVHRAIGNLGYEDVKEVIQKKNISYHIGLHL